MLRGEAAAQVRKPHRRGRAFARSAVPPSGKGAQRYAGLGDDGDLQEPEREARGHDAGRAAQQPAFLASRNGGYHQGAGHDLLQPGLQPQRIGFQRRTFHVRGGAHKEAEQILSDARKTAMHNETKIIDEAKAEAARIIERANVEAELEKQKVADEVKQQIVTVAAVMASKLVARSIDEKDSNALIEETLNEMGEKTWLS